MNCSKIQVCPGSPDSWQVQGLPRLYNSTQEVLHNTGWLFCCSTRKRLLGFFWHCNVKLSSTKFTLMNCTIESFSSKNPHNILFKFMGFYVGLHSKLTWAISCHMWTTDHRLDRPDDFCFIRSLLHHHSRPGPELQSMEMWIENEEHSKAP